MREAQGMGTRCILDEDWTGDEKDEEEEEEGGEGLEWEKGRRKRE